jgi:hypothetical protein
MGVARFFTASAPHIPTMPAVPKFRWFSNIYVKDVFMRLDDIKAAITSVHGTILKMDSTKKLSHKLAGRAGGTSSWVSNIGNEFNQILACVLTAKEGDQLGKLLNQLVTRYSLHSVTPPKILFVDRDCCGPRALKVEAWPDLHIQLDIWHFMRRFCVGISTESHPLFPSFMAGLSRCIFEWDADDVARLIRAKRAQLEASGRAVGELNDSNILQRITMAELALHCRRRTRGVEATISNIERLLHAYDAEKGRDSLGVPLINSPMMTEVWRRQRQHVKCIQDVADPDVMLYQTVGYSTQGGEQLPRYRCSRGSTSLENFHLHLNRFVPGRISFF